MATNKSWWSTLVNYVLFLINNAVYSGIPIFFWVRQRWFAHEMPNQAGKVRHTWSPPSMRPLPRFARIDQEV
jgi:hypothetical protein